ncbi:MULTISPECIES: hypothetical protein [Herbaspirillum]|uniref:Uncharacterized protein n=2 Tax=Herbaspirillum huttiense TaxID=863372 RepID=A0AAJ2H564_9BURK|nr:MULTISPECIES: hypothetical protein [Herbaspirillum]MDR9836979.1 hypothetical protein [Herbaspirillum huttiense]
MKASDFVVILTRLFIQFERAAGVVEKMRIAEAITSLIAAAHEVLKSDPQEKEAFNKFIDWIGRELAQVEKFLTDAHVNIPNVPRQSPPSSANPPRGL